MIANLIINFMLMNSFFDIYFIPVVFSTLISICSFSYYMNLIITKRNGELYSKQKTSRISATPMAD